MALKHRQLAPSSGARIDTRVQSHYVVTKVNSEEASLSYYHTFRAILCANLTKSDGFQHLRNFGPRRRD
jgi:hypothetical protein